MNKESMSKDSPLENSRSQMRKGILEFCILLIIARGRIYSSEILLQLKDADLLVVEGTLYPLLSRLKTQGLLEHSWEESKSGPPRKYFTLTNKGHDTLKELKATWKILSASIHSLINNK
ncbi:MAG: PadR family transcriptional regulator [Patescibacteria group bacterium]